MKHEWMNSKSELHSHAARSVAGALLCAAMTVAYAMPAHAFKALVSFDQTNGEDVFASVIQASDGNIYGTTVYGGAANAGVFFRLTPHGKYTVLHSFCAQAKCADGAYGEWLTEGSDGNLYGQTYEGGAANEGTIYKITKDGQLTTLYSFCSQANCTDGAQPQSALVQTSDGSFYGTTSIGGASNEGTVFKFVPGTGLTTLYSFCAQQNCTDGALPSIGLMLASDGNLYGTTAWGGIYNSLCGDNGCGTLFRISPKGKFAAVYNFCSQANCTDGSVPQGLLLEPKPGELYGTTDVGGTINAGSIFKISLTGKLVSLYSFCSNGCQDGAVPYAGFIKGTDGKLYGTAETAGDGTYGTVYSTTQQGKVTLLYDFNGDANGAEPAPAVIQASNGKLYGGTQAGGNANDGVLFDLTTKPPMRGDMNHRGSINRPVIDPRTLPLSPLGAR